ncbi:MAG: hypothetical protein KDC98_11080 [Planctomycetes bacterium]|nr:hypothetical protein [Planctomycetota bacterium]
MPLTWLWQNALPGCDQLASQEAIRLALPQNGPSNFSCAIPNSAVFAGISLCHQFLQFELLAGGQDRRLGMIEHECGVVAIGVEDLAQEGERLILYPPPGGLEPWHAVEILLLFHCSSKARIAVPVARREKRPAFASADADAAA